MMIITTKPDQLISGDHIILSFDLSTTNNIDSSEDVPQVVSTHKSTNHITIKTKSGDILCNQEDEVTIIRSTNKKNEV